MDNFTGVTASMNEFLVEAIANKSLILGSPFLEGPCSFKIFLKVEEGSEGAAPSLERFKEFQNNVNSFASGGACGLKLNVESEAIIFGVIYQHYQYEAFFDNLSQDQEPMGITEDKLLALLGNSKNEPLDTQPKELRAQMFEARGSGTVA